VRTVEPPKGKCLSLPITICIDPVVPNIDDGEPDTSCATNCPHIDHEEGYLTDDKLANQQPFKAV